MHQKKLSLTLISLALLLILAACGGSSAPESAADVSLEELPQDIDVETAHAIQDHPDVYMLDVREQEEYDEKHIPNINLLPMSTIQNRLDEIPTDKTVVVTCRSGNRSNQVTEFLRSQGFENAHNMTGGINEWEAAGFPVER